LKGKLSEGNRRCLRMAKQELVEGIKYALSRGESLKGAMMSFYTAGYPKEEIEKAAREVQASIFSSVPSIPEYSNVNQQKNYMPQTIQNVMPNNDVPIHPQQHQSYEQQIRHSTPNKVPMQSQLPAQQFPTQQIIPMQQQMPTQQAEYSGQYQEQYQEQYPKYNAPEQREKMQSLQIVSNYETQKSKGGFLLFLLIFLLLILVGGMIAIIFFKEEILNFFQANFG